MKKLAGATEQEIHEGPQAVCFQIADGNTRRSCILQTKLPTKVQAQRYLMANWPVIEKLARDALTTRTFGNDQIKLTMI
jgi:nucleoside-triphosphatase THEP1